MFGFVARMTSAISSSSMRAEQFLHAQLLRADAFDRRDRTLQHVVATAELAGALDRDDVARLLDDADDVRVAPLVATERAELAFGEVVATPAPRHAVLGVDDRGERGVLGRAFRDRTRCAARLRPTPGSRPSSSMRPGPALRRAPSASEQPPSPPRSSRVRAELLCCSPRCRPRDAATTSLERLDVVGVDDARVDRDREVPSRHVPSHAAADVASTRVAAPARLHVAASSAALHLFSGRSRTCYRGRSSTTPRRGRYKPRDGVGRRRVGRVDELVEIDRAARRSCSVGVGRGRIGHSRRSVDDRTQRIGRVEVVRPQHEARLEPELRRRTRP